MVYKVNAPILELVLFEPKIPPNTGNVIRLCANTGVHLHLIHPLGFSLEDKKLRRAGLDYHEFASLEEHDNFDAFLQKSQGKRLFACSTKGVTVYSDVRYQQGDVLLFGSETSGLPDSVLYHQAVEDVLTLPMKENSRSLNLSNAASIFVYEAWRQLAFSGA